MKRSIVLLALLVGCASPVDETSKVDNDAPAPVQSQAASLDNRLEDARWVAFLMEELHPYTSTILIGEWSGREQQKLGMSRGDYAVALLLEIAPHDLFTLRIAVEAIDDEVFEPFWGFERYLFESLICYVRLDQERYTKEEGLTFSGPPLTIEDGKLKIVRTIGQAFSSPSLRQLTDYSDGRTMHEIDVKIQGLRDLAPYNSQRLTEDQLGELRVKYAEWNGEVYVPDEPAEPYFEEPQDGLSWDSLGTVRSIENEHALSALRAANVRTKAHAMGGTTYVVVLREHLGRAQLAVRADAEEYGYAFREWPATPAHQTPVKASVQEPPQIARSPDLVSKNIAALAGTHRVGWVRFLIDRLYELKPADPDGEYGDYGAALWQEIASHDTEELVALVEFRVEGLGLRDLSHLEAQRLSNEQRAELWEDFVNDHWPDGPTWEEGPGIPIGSVKQSDWHKVSECLGEAGIPGMGLSGHGTMGISVPIIYSERATELLRKDAREKGYVFRE